MTEQTSRGAAYRKTAAAAQPTHEVQLPSGAVFLLRAPNLEAFVLSGVLPFDLTVKLDKMGRETGLTGAGIDANLSLEETAQSIEFERALIKQICVDPKIVDVVTNDDDVAFTELTNEDLRFLMSWGMSGGSAAGDSFRQEPIADAVAGANGKKLRIAAK